MSIFKPKTEQPKLSLPPPTLVYQNSKLRVVEVSYAAVIEDNGVIRAIGSNLVVEKYYKDSLGCAAWNMVGTEVQLCSNPNLYADSIEGREGWKAFFSVIKGLPRPTVAACGC
jgi:hypothetical protein